MTCPYWSTARQLADAGVGAEALVARAVARFEGVESGAGVRAFPADQHAGAGRRVGQGVGREQTGELGDVGAVAGLAGGA